MWSIVIVGVLTLIYTFEGGIAAVIWTDLIQLIIYIGGSLVAAYMLWSLIPGGWTEIAAQARRMPPENCRFFHSAPNFEFALYFLGGTFRRNIFNDGFARHRPTARADDFLLAKINATAKKH